MDSVPVVLDCGGSLIKAGFGGDSEPGIVFPSTGPRLRKDGEFDDKRYFSKFGPTFRSPIENRTVVNFENMRKIWAELFTQQLKIQPEHHPFLVVDSPLNPIENRQQILEIFMEEYNVPSFCPAYASSLALYNSGYTSGVVVDCGEWSTDIIPVFECFTLTHLISRVDVGGKHVSEYLKKLLNQQGTVLPGQTEKGILREVKEQIGFVRGDPSPSDDEEKIFLTHDGIQLCIGRPRYQCTEVLFEPNLSGSQSQGIPKSIIEVIRKTDEDIVDVLADNVLLSGGTTCVTGFTDRVEKGILIHNPTQIKVNVNAPANRKFASWVGGSILSCVDTFKDISITKSEYEESGQSILELKSY